MWSRIRFLVPKRDWTGKNQWTNEWCACAGGASVIFDTDVLIWVQRGNVRAAQAIQDVPLRRISILTQMELMQGVRDRREAQLLRSFLAQLHFTVLPLTEAVGHRAAVYVEQLGLSHGVRTNDAVIAATAMEWAEPLCTANGRHFRPIKELDLRMVRV